MPLSHTSGGVLSASHGTFFYSAYFDMWSRVLLRAGRAQGFLQEISIPITPYRGWYDDESVEKIKECIVNVFDPCISKQDKYTNILPANIYNMMLEIYGEELTDFLIDKDILRYINLKILLDPNVNKGGVPFKVCSSDNPSKKGLIDRLKDYPELYIMPPALEKYKRNKTK